MGVKKKLVGPTKTRVRQHSRPDVQHRCSTRSRTRGNQTTFNRFLTRNWKFLWPI